MRILLLLLSSFVALHATAQNIVPLEPKTGKIAPSGKVILSDTTQADYDPVVTNIKEQPNPASGLKEKKALLFRERMATKNAGVKKNAARSGSIDAPLYVTGFNANTPQGTPNDNHLAISNDGIIVSVVNTNIRIYDTLGNMKTNRSLQNFASSLGVFTQNSDPRVIYDPKEDRFILLFFSGNTSSTNRIVVGFSKTSDPTGQWNIYALPGNYLNDTTWSDYPIVSITKNDLFITFNQLKDGEGWQTGFRYSIIWQIDKSKGYAGDSLAFNYWSKPTHNGKPIWSICTVMEGSDFNATESYFISVRPDALSNDTVFLHTVSNSVASGNATFSTKVLKANTPYGLAPNAVQADGQQLATNDARALHAIIHNNRIYYAQNCKTPIANTAGVYLGRIDNPGDANPTVTGKIIGFDTIDLGYPSLAHIGKGNADFRTLLTCSFVSGKSYPGTAAFFIDNSGNFSEMLIVKQGDNNLNILIDSTERWGDYTGIQRRYNEDFTAWLCGSYARQNNSYGTWIAKVTIGDTTFISSINSLQKASIKANAFPNPANERFSITFETQKENQTEIALCTVEGKIISKLLEDRLKAGTNLFSFSTESLTKGTYLLLIKENGEIKATQKIIIQ